MNIIKYNDELFQVKQVHGSKAEIGDFYFYYGTWQRIKYHFDWRDYVSDIFREISKLKAPKKDEVYIYKNTGEEYVVDYVTEKYFTLIEKFTGYVKLCCHIDELVDFYLSWELKAARFIPDKVGEYWCFVGDRKWAEILNVTEEILKLTNGIAGNLIVRLENGDTIYPYNSSLEWVRASETSDAIVRPHKNKEGKVEFNS